MLGNSFSMRKLLKQGASEKTQGILQPLWYEFQAKKGVNYFFLQKLPCLEKCFTTNSHNTNKNIGNQIKSYIA